MVMVNTQYVLSMGILATTCESELAVASMCHAHFAYCSMLHFSQPRYRCKATSKECIAVRSLLGSGRSSEGWNVGTMPLLSSRMPIQNLVLLKFWTIKFSQFSKIFKHFPLYECVRFTLRSWNPMLQLTVVHRSPGNVCTCTARVRATMWFACECVRDLFTFSRPCFSMLS